MTITEQINEWIAKYGNERDALNVALAKLEAAQIECSGLHFDADMYRRKEVEHSVAPELLEALEKASELLDALRIESGIGNSLTEPEKETYKFIDDKVKAVIAKARGEQ